MDAICQVFINVCAHTHAKPQPRITNGDYGDCEKSEKKDSKRFFFFDTLKDCTLLPPGVGRNQSLNVCFSLKNWFLCQTAKVTLQTTDL